jgi:hypothetical protein
MMIPALIVAAYRVAYNPHQGEVPDNAEVSPVLIPRS